MVVLFLLSLVLSLVNGQQPCKKIDFDTQDVNDLIQCPQVPVEGFVKKLYANSRIIRPFREGAMYYLSNRNAGVTCAETAVELTLDENSVIQMTNFLMLENSSMKVRVRNVETSEIVAEWILPDEDHEWRIFDKQPGMRIPRAKVRVQGLEKQEN